MCIGVGMGMAMIVENVTACVPTAIQ